MKRVSEPASQPASQKADQQAARESACPPEPAAQAEPADGPSQQPARQAASQPANGVDLLGVALLYESPGGNQVDGLPPVATLTFVKSWVFLPNCRGVEN